jgi:hypothetical protein
MGSNFVVVKQVKPNLPLFDVFVGDGWLNWSRVAWDMKKKRLSLIKGERLSSLSLRSAYDQVEKLLHHEKAEA